MVVSRGNGGYKGGRNASREEAIIKLKNGNSIVCLATVGI